MVSRTFHKSGTQNNGYCNYGIAVTVEDAANIGMARNARIRREDMEAKKAARLAAAKAKIMLAPVNWGKE